MQNTIQKLDTLLQEKRSDYYQYLRPGLSNNQIKDLETEHNIQLPNDLKILYQWKNGHDGYESFINNQTFSSLRTVLEDREIFNDLLKAGEFDQENYWNSAWLPIFSNGGGSHICYDLTGVFTGQAGQILEFWKGGNERNVISNSLEALLLQLVNYLESAETEELTEDSSIEQQDIPGFPIKFV